MPLYRFDLDSLQGPPLVLLDPARMCRKGTRKFRDSMNVIMPGKSSFMNPSHHYDDTSFNNSIIVNNNNNKKMGLNRYRRKVNTYCAKEAEVMKEASRGAKLATLECQFQFKNRHWNCSSHPKSIRRILGRGKSKQGLILGLQVVLSPPCYL